MATLTGEQVWNLLDEIKDPEIPVVSLIEMGMIRGVQVEAAGRGQAVRVDLAPTFAGCPALRVMQEQIERRLKEAGAQRVEVRLALSPPWSSDWITPAGRQKLKDFGLAPPRKTYGRIDLEALQVVTCPYCGSQDTTLKNSFGSTLCRMIFYCNHCQQPFEQFKPL